MMRHVFVLMAMPLLFDVGVGVWLGAGDQQTVLPPQTEAIRGYVVFFDWDQVELSATGRRVVAAAAHAASLHGVTRIEVLGVLDHTAGPDYNSALAKERTRRVQAELLRDGMTALDISVHRAGSAAHASGRIELVLQQAS